MDRKARFEFRILGLLRILCQNVTDQGVWAPGRLFSPPLGPSCAERGLVCFVWIPQPPRPTSVRSLLQTAAFDHS